MSPFKRALLLAAIAYCILCLARGESFDPVALAKDENADLSALSGEQLYAVADEDAVQFSKTHPLGDDITYSYRIGESHALKHQLRGEPQSLYTAYFADAIEAIRADSEHPHTPKPN
jgi:hypothetical protein